VNEPYYGEVIVSLVGLRFVVFECIRCAQFVFGRCDIMDSGL
jgi:hypothetical protein